MNRNGPLRVNRPLPLYLIVAFYVLAPLANLAIYRLATGLPGAVIISRLVRAAGPLAVTWMLSAPLVGIALIFTTRFSWYLFLGHSSLVLVDYGLKWATRPGYYWSTIASPYQVMMLAGNLALVCAMALLCTRNFRAPYLQGARRGWRYGPRVLLQHWISVDGRPRPMTSISPNGCFVADPTANLAVGQIVSLRFQSSRLQLECPGCVIRRDRDGFGVEFLFLPSSIREDIRQAIHPRTSPRHDCHIPCTVKVDGEERSGVLRNLSTGGCFVETSAGELAAGTRASVFVAGLKQALDLRVAWSGLSGVRDGVPGMGARFAHSEARAVAELEHLYAVA